MTDNEYMRVLHAQDYQTKPWKNGQGTTRDILLSPEAEDFDIRVSLADIPRESTFSAFPGITRHITLLAGDAMTLAFADGNAEHLRPMVPLTFDSGQTPFCQASAGTVRVLNVMARATAWQSSVAALAQGRHRAEIPAGGAILLFAALGRWTAQAGSSTADCAEGETALAAGSAAVNLSGSLGAKALLATLTPTIRTDETPFGFFKANATN